MAKDDDHRGAKGVGYGRPPKEHTIKPGETRNPWGRNGKPGSKTDFMDELIEICIDGKYRKVKRAKALDYGLFQEAVKGNVSAAKELERRRIERARTAINDTADTLLSAEQAALDRLIQRKLEERQASTKATPDNRLQQLKAAARVIVPGDKK